MNWDEYNKLFHKEQLNLVAFRCLMDCDEQVLRLVNSAIASSRNDTLEEVAKEFEKMPFGDTAASFAQHVRNMKND